MQEEEQEQKKNPKTEAKEARSYKPSVFRESGRILYSHVRRNPFYLLAVGFVIAYLVYSALAALFPQITGFDPNALNLNVALHPPSLAYPFGTDNLGRNLLNRVMAGAPIDAAIALIIVSFSFLFGALTGSIAGYYGGLVDEIIMRITDIFLAFPGIILALAIAAALGPGLLNAVLALSVVWWPIYTRLARGETLSVNSNQFILAARASGLPRSKIVTRHIIPNVIAPMIAYATTDVGNVIILFSVLGYLGLGAQPPLVDVGRLVYDGQNFIQSAPWYPIIPGIVIFVIVISFALVGDLIRDMLDPHWRI